MTKVSPQRILREAIELFNEYVPDNEELIERCEHNLDELEDLIKRLDAAGITNL